MRMKRNFRRKKQKELKMLEVKVKLYLHGLYSPSIYSHSSLSQFLLM